MLVRKDLPPAQQLVQAVHAAHEAGIRFGDPSLTSSVVVCSVPDERSLLSSKEELEARGIKSYIFHEDDFGDQATALASEPLWGQRRKAFARYPLWGSVKEEV